MASSKAELAHYSSWNSNWAELKIAVIGLGKTGFSVADTLNELGSDLLAVSENADAQVLDILDVLGVEYLVTSENQEIIQRLEDFSPDLAVISPGIRPDNYLISWLDKNAIQIWTDIDLAWRLRDKFGSGQEWICITGTNGKTTTTELTEAMFLSGGVRAAACGNIGKPILDCIRDPAAFQVLIVELSSFQLHYLDSIQPFSSTVLNLAEDHLDWHGNFEAYKKAKGKIYANTKVACVYNLDDLNTQNLVEQAEVEEGARAIGFSLGTPSPSNIGYVDNLLVDRAFLDERKTSALEIAALEDMESLGVLTPHLLANVAAAAALSRSFDIPVAAIKKALQDFHISPHRIELVGESGGVRFINDSKATNAHAAAASIRSFDKVVWIVGGLLKGQDLGPLVSKLGNRLRAAIVIGKDRIEVLEALSRFASEVPVYEIPDTESIMQSAVSAAIDCAQPGDTVLLAPAAASMDQFVDYEDRGKQFIAEVRKRIQQ